MSDSGLHFHAASRSLRRERMSADGMALRKRHYNGLAAQLLREFETPGEKLHIAPAARAELGAPVLRALAAAVAAPKPLWLTLHLWRNRVDAASFTFDLSASLEQQLVQLAEDLYELKYAHALDAERVTRVLSVMVQVRGRAPLSASKAAGPLPKNWPYPFHVKDGNRQLCMFVTAYKLSDSSPGAPNSPWLTDASAAVLERLFLAPPCAPVPYAVLASSGVPVLVINVSPTPCIQCGGSRFSRLYYDKSPTWRSTVATVSGRESLDASNFSGAPLRSCMCKVCDGCGVMLPKANLKRCSGCLGVLVCREACMRHIWPQHK